LGLGDADVCAERIAPQTPRPRPAGGGGFGDALRRAREARGLTLAAVAEKTRIASHHLEALERGDLEAMPAGPFGKSYVRSYAEVLGIDPAPILEAYHAQELRRGVGTAERDQRMLEELSHLVGGSHEGGARLGRLRRRPARVAAAVALVAVLGAAGWLVVRHRGALVARSAAGANPVHGPAPGVTPAPLAKRSPPPAPVPPAGLAVPSPAQPPAPRTAAPTTPRPGVPRQEGAVAKPPAPGRPTDTLQVAEFGVGSDVVDHRLVGRADRFPEGTRVYFWTLVVGGRAGDVVRHVWFQGGHAVVRADLPIGGPHWRTQSSLVLPYGSAGPWTVEARTSDGRLLARNDFLCERRPSP
jgi:transcriptional regulator with XRE-family HTH domain